jgi:Ca-activated chloride channel family protein
MKLSTLASTAFLALSLLNARSASAAGFIMIDGGVTPIPMIVHPTVVPVHPGLRSPAQPVLKGAVSYGIHLQSEDIKVDVANQVAKTYITQTFVNDTDRNLAGTYLFPLPDDTTFSSFSLHIDGKPVEGKILEASEARQEYETIVRKMIDPGLLEYADYKTVRARVFPIPAHGTKKVELEYTQVLSAENGMIKYKFPLKAQGESPAVDEVKIDVKLASKQALRTIWSPTHTINAQRTDDHDAKISLLSHDIVPDKDFLLYFSVSDKDFAANLMTQKIPDEDGYFLLTLAPPVKGPQIAAKDIVLVVDTSGSMQGQKIEECKKALTYIVNALGLDDHFSLVRFNTDVDTFKSHVVPATAENKKSALAFINDLDASGGTNISDALRVGTNLLNEEGRPSYLILMTDGEPTVGETNIQNIVKGLASKRDIRLFDFGVGYDVNTKLLNELAENHHGTAQYVEPSENLETALSSFYQKIKSPVLSDVKIEYNGIQVKDVYPREVKDIFAGNQVILIGKYKDGGKATVNLTGKINGVTKAYSFPLNFEKDASGHSYLPRLWAMRRIGHLTDVAQQTSDNREMVDEIVALSKKYGIISQYTSFLVTDPSENHRLANQVGGPGIVPSPILSLRSTRGGFAGSIAAGGGADFYAARQIQIIDNNPVVNGFRESKALGSVAPASPAGQIAVQAAKKANLLKSSDAVDNDAIAFGIKIVEDKTFYLKENEWVDSMFQSTMQKGIKPIQFGSKAYFDLIKANPGIVKYLALGEQVLVVYRGNCYRIVAHDRKIT